MAGSNAHTIKLQADSTDVNSVAFVASQGVHLTDDTNAKTITISADVLTSGSGYHGASSTTAVADPNNTEGFRIEFADDNNHSAEAFLNPTITIGSNDTAVKFINGTADLSVYTMDEIDDKLIAVNAMVYKGTISNGTAPSSNVSIGDTYKIITSPATVDSGTAKVGDLIIARGTEGDDGYITAATLTWDIVPSGDEAAYDFDLSQSHTVGLKQGAAVLGEYGLAAADSKITLTDTDTTGSKVVTIGHGVVGTGSNLSLTATAEADSTIGSDYTIYGLTNVSIDSTGHVAGATLKSYKVKGNKLSSGSDTLSVTTAGSASTIGGSAVLKDTWETQDLSNATAGDDHSLAISSSTLAVSAAVASATNTGTFTIDMIWGEF